MPSARSWSRAIWSTGDRIEIVNGRIPVAEERPGRHLGQRLRDLRQSVLHPFVERRAPEREPPAVAVMQVGVDESLRHREPRELDHGEERARRVAELGLARRCVGERDQLADADRPRARALVAGAACEHGRRRVLLQMISRLDINL